MHPSPGTARGLDLARGAGVALTAMTLLLRV
jgi:hypothetical protein